MNKKNIQISDIKKPFWSFQPEEIFALLTTQKNGLTQKEADKRLKKFGTNQFGKPARFVKTKIFLRQFKSPLIFILFIAGGVTIYLDKWTDSSVIFLAILVNTFLGFYQENRAENAIENLRSYIKERVRVIRNGREKEIDASQLVPGDVIHVVSGARVPADARLLSINGLYIDEALLTGESLPVSKSIEVLSEGASLPERKNMIHGGTLVIDGYATAVVVATGHNTEIGKIAQLLTRSPREQVPLQKAMTKLAWLIAVVLLLFVIMIFVLGLARGVPVYEMFLLSAAVAVGAIPEALPIALTVVLAISVERLAKRKGIVRNLAAAETLGSTSVIITDKTGTLTEANMKLVNTIPASQLLLNKKLPKHDLVTLTKKQRELLVLASRNTDVAIENPEDKPDTWRMSGKPLEVNILKALISHDLDPLQLADHLETELVLPFNSDKKFSVSRIYQLTQGSYVGAKYKTGAVVLGAPDVLLQRSGATREKFEKLSSQIEKLSDEGKRVLGVGFKKFPKHITAISADDIVDIEFLGVLCFVDPIRPQVPEAIQDIEKSGVRVIMATGDLKGTAIAVASDLGWTVDAGEVITGQEMRQLSDKELLASIEKIKIYARVTPEDKRRLGVLLQQSGEIVGMTGDGVNDAPSLQAVDIGIAVGSGSDVAKDVADIVLLDDNFLTVASAIDEGRRTLGNIRKSFVYLMSNSLDSVMIVGGSLLTGLPVPLTALQIIWVNFFTGSWPALSFAFDEHTDKHYITAENARYIIDKEVKFLTLGIGVLTSGFLFLLYWLLIEILALPSAEVNTYIFACFASYILFVAFSFRSLRQPLFSYRVFSNKFLNASVVFGIILIGATIYIEPLQPVFGTTALSVAWLVAVGAWVVFNISLVEFTKLIFRKIG